MKLIVLLVMAALSQASTITFKSGDNINEWNSRTGVNVVLTSHEVWATGTGEWISFANTGVGPGSFSPPNNWAPIANFYESFFLNSASKVMLHVWADDTASVWLNGQEIIPVWPTQDGHCASGPVGCEVGEDATTLLSLTTGFHELRFDPVQRDSGPTGVRYFGEFVETPNQQVPEPSTWMMLSVGLMLCLYGRRRFYLQQ